MDYRKFWIINSLGERFDMTKENSTIFLDKPEGFGFERQYSSQKVGNSELVTAQEFVLTDIKGELLFFDSTNGFKYQRYQDFIQFAKYKPLEFHYQTPNDEQSYHSEVLFVQAEKTQTGEDGILRVPVVFHRLTEWLTDTTFVMVLNNDPVGNGKYFNADGESPYMLHYQLADGDTQGNPATAYYCYAGTSLDNAEIINEGTDDVGFQIEVTGRVQNMQFSLAQDGEIYGICKINGTYDKIIINSVERSESIYLEYNNSVVSNPEQYQDFTIGNGVAYLTWCKIKVGTSTFGFTCGNIETFSGNVKLTFNKSYVTV